MAEVVVMCIAMPEVSVTSVGEIENIDILCPPLLLRLPALEMENVKQAPNS